MSSYLMHERPCGPQGWRTRPSTFPDMKIGQFEYQVAMNASPPTIQELNAIPIKSMSNGATIFVRDVANVRNGFIPQTNVVRFDGARATMLDVQKIGSASTLDIVEGIKRNFQK